MARFQGNIHEGSDRAAALVVTVALIIVAAIALAYFLDPVAFNANWNNLVNTTR